jgi:hypothetical protein
LIRRMPANCEHELRCANCLPASSAQLNHGARYRKRRGARRAPSERCRSCWHIGGWGMSLRASKPLPDHSQGSIQVSRSDP